MTKHRSKKYSLSPKRTEFDFESVLMKASLAHREGRLAEAEKGYREVLRRKPDWGQVLNALGTVFLDQSLPDKAGKVFEKAANLRPPNIPACYNLARLMQRPFTGPCWKTGLILVKPGIIWVLHTGKPGIRMKPCPVFRRQ